MEAARNAIAQHTARKGHVTDVEESFAPAVVSEKILPTRHEIVREAVHRDVYHDHYHTTVQPISHQEILPTKHFYRTLPVKQVEIHHDNEQGTQPPVAAATVPVLAPDLQLQHDLDNSLSGYGTAAASGNNAHSTTIPVPIQQHIPAASSTSRAMPGAFDNSVPFTTFPESKLQHSPSTSTAGYSTAHESDHEYAPSTSSIGYAISPEPEMRRAPGPSSAGYRTPPRNTIRQIPGASTNGNRAAPVANRNPGFSVTTTGPTITTSTTTTIRR